MRSLNTRLLALEHVSNTAPMLTMHVQGLPTAEQSAMIDRCTRTNRRLIVFYDPGNTAWLAGHGVPPWGAEHDNA